MRSGLSVHCSCNPYAKLTRQVEWPEIIADKTGLHMDGGPYMLSVLW